MKANDLPDIYRVSDHHDAVHARLVNWARWSADGRGYQQSPMFKVLGYRSNWRQWHPVDPRPVVDTLDALRVERALRLLPRVNRMALIWWYVKSSAAPRRIAFQLGLSEAGLCDAVHRGRAMLDNVLRRGVASVPDTRNTAQSKPARMRALKI